MCTVLAAGRRLPDGLAGVERLPAYDAGQARPARPFVQGALAQAELVNASLSPHPMTYDYVICTYGPLCCIITVS